MPDKPVEPVYPSCPSRRGPGLGCLTGSLFGLQFLILLFGSALGDGLLGMIGSSIFCMPLSLLLLVVAVLAARQKRWVLAVVALLLALPALLVFRLLL